MTRYHSKLDAVEAERWAPDAQIRGVRACSARIHYDAKEKFYFVTKDAWKAVHWLGLEELPNGGRQKMFFAAHRDDGAPVRVRPHREADLDESDPLFEAYAVSMSWPPAARGPARLAFLEQQGRPPQLVRVGDWVVTRRDGTRTVYSDGDFHQQFEVAR